MGKILASALGLALVASACSGGGGEASSGTPDNTVDIQPGDVQLVAGRLVAFDDCDALLSHIKAEASERVGPYGLDGYGGPVLFDDVAVEEADDGGDDATAGTDSAAESDSFEPTGGAEGEGGDFTTTNVQELGVDEPDIIKTDGNRIIAISEQILSYIDLSGDEPVLTDQLTLSEGWAHELFFDGDRAIVFTNGGQWGAPLPIGRSETGTVGDLADDAEEDFVSDAIEPGFFSPSAGVFEIDLSDPERLEITSSLRMQGEYLSARRVGDTIRMAMTSPPTQLPWLYPQGQAGEDRAEQANRDLIAETTIEDWIPQFELSRADESTSGPLLSCDRLYTPAEFAGFDIVSVLSFDIGDGITGSGEGAAVLASGRTVYSSTDRFYVATTQWAPVEFADPDATDDIGGWEESYSTDIHAFSITPESPADYVASGEVPGSLLNQFSMDEHEGYLRIITTDGSPWSDRQQSETKLTVMTEDGDQLVQVGQVGGLGKGESLYSARLLDDVGFAVTFRQIDPFYVLDLSDPTNPTVSGELKIPGVSTYLHPISDTLVLGIGQDATEEGRTTGLKVSLFDVGDPANPTEVAVWTKPGAYSSAEYDHRAFLYLPDSGIAVLPFDDWQNQSNGAVLLQIEDDAIAEVGSLTHIEPKDEPTSDCSPLEASDFPEETELFWVAQEGGRVQLCGEGDVGGYGSFYCEPIPVDNISEWIGRDASAVVSELLNGAEAGPEDRIEICWPDEGNWRQQIQRSMVIDGDLWTFSWDRLQANDLDTLELVDVVKLNTAN